MSEREAQREQLLARARSLGGRTLAELSVAHMKNLPGDTKRDKGFVGRLLEHALGVDAGSKPGPDVPRLGLEVKTLPLNARGEPAESTFVCTIRLSHAAEARWETSGVRHKLACVLWVPLEAAPDVPLASRRVGSAFLWCPSQAEWQQLEADWTELMGELGRAGPEAISGHLGRWLQVRPKAAHGAVRTHGHGEALAPARVPPRAFYLRARFTKTLLRRAF